MDGVHQGVTTWGLTSVVLLYLLTTAIGGLVGGAFSVVSGAASAAGQSVQAAAPEVAQATGVSPKDVTSKVTDLFDNQPRPPPEQMTREQAATAMTNLVPKLAGDDQESKQAYQRARAIVAVQSSIGQQGAEKKVDKLQQEHSRQ